MGFVQVVNWQNRLNDLDFLPLQNARLYHSHNVSENVSILRNLGQK